MTFIPMSSISCNSDGDTICSLLCNGHFGYNMASLTHLMLLFQRFLSTENLTESSRYMVLVVSGNKKII